MPLDRTLLFTRVGDEIDYGLAYAFGVLSNLAYYPDQNFDNAWGAAFGMTDTLTVTTPGVSLPNYTRIRASDSCVFAIAGTTHNWQMYDSVVYSGQVQDLDFGAGYVHSFFRWIARGLIPFIDADLAGRSHSTKLAFCGHSLGGAVAQLLSWYYALQGWDVRNCVVFNSPKVGNREFANLSRPFGYWHVVNSYDKISGLPPVATFEFTNGFPVFDQDLNIWWQASPMFEVTVPQILTLPQPNPPTSRAGSVFPWLDSLAKWLEKQQFETRRVREQRQRIQQNGVRAVAPVAGGYALYRIFLTDHKLERLLAQMLKLYSGTIHYIDVSDIAALQEHLNLEPVELANATPYPRDFGLVDPTPFLTPTPPASPAVTPTPAPPGTVIEATTVNAAVVSVPRDVFVPETVRTELSIVPPGAADVPFFSRPRPHFFFRGTDRRLLQKLVKILDLIEARDDVAANPARTGKISNRDTVLDWDDDAQVANWYAVRSQAIALMSLAYDD